jgi:hypothetical protein
LLNKSGQLAKRLGFEPAWPQTKRVISRRIAPVSPVARDAKAATLVLLEDQRINARYTSFLEYFEALASKRMERMADFRPSQMLAVFQCSLR